MCFLENELLYIFLVFSYLSRMKLAQNFIVKLFHFATIFLATFIYSSKKPCLRFLLICFAQEKIIRFPKKRRFISWTWWFSQIKKIFKTESGFCRWKRMIVTTLRYSCHWRTLVSFRLQKKIPENSFSTLTVNYLKITLKNNLRHPKQH